MDDTPEYFDPEDYDRPEVYGDCGDIPPGCPFVSCRHSIFLDVDRMGKIRHRFPGKEPDEVGQELCSLKIAERGGLDEREMSESLGMSHQRVNAIIHSAIRKLHKVFTDKAREENLI